MKVDLLDALLAYAILCGVGSSMFFFNKIIFTDTANFVFGHFQRQGAEDERRRMGEEEDEDLLRVQVIDDVGEKCH